MPFSWALRHKSAGVRLGDYGGHIIGEFHPVSLETESPRAALCKGKKAICPLYINHTVCHTAGGTPCSRTG